MIFGRRKRGNAVEDDLREEQAPEETAMPEDDDVDADVLAGTIALHGAYEGWIRERPAEWMWSIRKWGRKPEAVLAAMKAEADAEPPRG